MKLIAILLFAPMMGIAGLILIAQQTSAWAALGVLLCLWANNIDRSWKGRLGEYLSGE